MNDTSLVPLAGSKLAEWAIPYAADLAMMKQANLVLMHALPARAPESAIDEMEVMQAELGTLADGFRVQGVAAKAITGRSFLSHPTLAISGAAEE